MTYDDSKNRVNFCANAFLALGSFLGAAGLSAGSASAGSAVSETVLYSFCQQPNCADGAFPEAGLIATTQGGLYGTTEQGGGTVCNRVRCGVAFRVSITGGGGILHQFQGGFMDGEFPDAPLFRDNSGNFYGTTSQGGGTGCILDTGCGTVFERSASGVYKLLHRFNGTDGSFPQAGLVADSVGDLYGTTESGGANGQGTIFRLTPGGILTTLYSFCSMTACADGEEPVAGLIGDANGNLYGTTLNGGEAGCNNILLGLSGCGVVFKIHADGSNYTVLHAFTGGTGDGGNPVAGLSADPSGNLYGTTFSGGANNGGTVFKIAPDGSNYALLYNFCSLASCADGAGPNGVILDAGGNLYGTTQVGGDVGCVDLFGPVGCGVVFALTPSGTETVLHSFCSLAACADGSFPNGNLVALFPGNLYGTTSEGGTMKEGTVYQLTNTGFVLPSAAAKR